MYATIVGGEIEGARLRTRSEEWCVEAGTPEEAKALLDISAPERFALRAPFLTTARLVCVV